MGILKRYSRSNCTKHLIRNIFITRVLWELAESSHLHILHLLLDCIIGTIDVECFIGFRARLVTQQCRINVLILVVHPTFVLGNTLNPELSRSFSTQGSGDFIGLVQRGQDSSVIIDAGINSFIIGIWSNDTVKGKK